MLAQLLVIVLFVALSDGKEWKGSARLSPKKPWVPLSNFAFERGIGQVNTTALKVDRLAYPLVAC